MTTTEASYAPYRTTQNFWIQGVGGFLAYNIGSLFVGATRAIVAVKYLSNHFSKVEQYVNMTNNLTSQYYMRIEDLNGKPRYDFNENKFKDHKSFEKGTKESEKKIAIQQLGFQFPSEQRGYWLRQLLRAITEIALPIIGSLAWTVYDIVTQGKVLDKHDTQDYNKNNVSGKFHGDIPAIDNPDEPEKDLFKYNVGGINYMLVAMKWEADIGKAIANKVFDEIKV